MNLSTSDWIGIAQTIVLFLTGLAVAWYTVETVKIRKETNNQNTMLAEQLRLMQATIQHDLEKEASFIRPFFKFGGGMRSSGIAQATFTNKGGPAKKITVTNKGEFNITVNPTRYMDTNDNGTIQIMVPNPLPDGKYPFELSCQDKLGTVHHFNYYYDYRTTAVFEEEQT